MHTKYIFPNWFFQVHSQQDVGGGNAASLDADLVFCFVLKTMVAPYTPDICLAHSILEVEPHTEVVRDRRCWLDEMLTMLFGKFHTTLVYSNQTSSE